jgi:osmotically-inducible protein OsmY
MFPTQSSSINSDEFPGYEEQGQVMVRKASFGPILKTDAEINESIYHGLLKDDVLQALEYHEIDVHVKNGIVYLNGHIMSPTSQNWIENAIRAIPGIPEIKSNLVLDNKLTLEVAASLEKLEDTYGCKFFTGTSHGVVSLSGTVSAENVKLLAEKCVARHPNVRGVINNVRIAGARVGLQRQSFVQPGIGAIIYFLDGTFGAVKQVIIDPNNRCVVQVILQGQSLDQGQGLKLLTNNQAEILEKPAVIPVNLIGYLTNSSGFLTIKSTETKQYADFDPSHFSVPNMDWVPPYPYRPEDVLFTVGAAEIENQILVDPDLVQLNAPARLAFPHALETPVDVVAAWEDDGGKIIQNAEAMS